MRIGIDFGTTHTSAAIYDGSNLTFIPLDQKNADPHILRSMIYVNRAQEHCLGLEAVETFLAEDTGRPIVYEEKVVGTIENTVAQTDGSRTAAVPDGPIIIIYDVLIDEDVGARGRLLQSIKTGLRSSWYEGTTIFGRYYTIQELIALLLTHVRSSAETMLQADVDEAVLGRPVTFTDDQAGDELAEQRLREAAKLAGFQRISFTPEPIAAALFYLTETEASETILIFDFGGGTLDLTVMRTRIDAAQADESDAQGKMHPRYEILASHGVLIGGDDLDSALMTHQIAPYFGTASKIDIAYNGREIYLPADMVRNLSRWQTIPQLSREDSLKVIERAKQYGENQQAFLALESLVTRNYGFALFEKIEQAKRILSSERETTVQMQAESIDLLTEVTRRQFNQAIGDEIVEIRTAVREIIRASGILPTQIDAVVTTGGSSTIPVFQGMLKREFPEARLVQSDAFGSVTGGLAIEAF